VKEGKYRKGVEEAKEVIIMVVAAEQQQQLWKECQTEPTPLGKEKEKI